MPFSSGLGTNLLLRRSNSHCAHLIIGESGCFPEPGGILYTRMTVSRERKPRSAAASIAIPGRVGTSAHPAMQPIDAGVSFKQKAYTALKNAIVSMDIYRNRDEIRLDERKLAQDFGISRTPVREAMAQLEREGFVA